MHQNNKGDNVSHNYRYYYDEVYTFLSTKVDNRTMNSLLLKEGGDNAIFTRIFQFPFCFLGVHHAPRINPGTIRGKIAKLRLVIFGGQVAVNVARVRSELARNAEDLAEGYGKFGCLRHIVSLVVSSSWNILTRSFVCSLSSIIIYIHCLNMELNDSSYW